MFSPLPWLAAAGFKKKKKNETPLLCEDNPVSLGFNFSWQMSCARTAARWQFDFPTHPGGVISGLCGRLFTVESPPFGVTNQRAIVLDGEQLLQWDQEIIRSNILRTAWHFGWLRSCQRECSGMRMNCMNVCVCVCVCSVFWYEGMNELRTDWKRDSLQISLIKEYRCMRLDWEPMV